MSTETILYFAVGVFLLMMIGIGLTAMEFKKIERDTEARNGTSGTRRT